MSRRSLLAIAVALALIVGLGAGAWAMPSCAPIKGQGAQIERDVAVQVFGLGTVEARVSSQVGFKVSGVLVDLRADVGDRVAKGTVLARLDDREQSAQVRQSEGVRGTGISQSEKSRRQASKRPRLTMPTLIASVSAVKNWFESANASIETAETAKAVRDAALGRFELGKQRCSGGERCDQ